MYRHPRILVLSILVVVLSGTVLLVTRNPYGFKDTAGRIKASILDPALLSKIRGISIRTTRGTVKLLLSGTDWLVQDPESDRFFPATTLKVERFLKELSSVRIFEETGRGADVRKELGLDEQNAWIVSLSASRSDVKQAGAESGINRGQPDTPGGGDADSAFPRSQIGLKNPGTPGSSLSGLINGMKPPASLIDSLNETLLIGYTDDSGSRIHVGISGEDRVWSTDPEIFRIAGRDYRYWLDLAVFPTDRLSAGIDAAIISLVYSENSKTPATVSRSLSVRNSPENHEILKQMSTLSAEEIHFPDSLTVSGNEVALTGEKKSKKPVSLLILLMWSDGRSSALKLQAPEPSGHSRFRIDDRPWEYSSTAAARLYDSINSMSVF